VSVFRMSMSRVPGSRSGLRVMHAYIVYLWIGSQGDKDRDRGTEGTRE
jgi:hypothetical protein